MFEMFTKADYLLGGFCIMIENMWASFLLEVGEVVIDHCSQFFTEQMRKTI